ncbi:hypothetical protein BaRGS_00008196 [Batillaria attramentaria]|uniref:Uncharacterized protein n=1 Tax=Batillaria attramentaria TaxID=370345 RepID=A0ABD0LM33_9CAEN
MIIIQRVYHLVKVDRDTSVHSLRRRTGYNLVVGHYEVVTLWQLFSNSPILAKQPGYSPFGELKTANLAQATSVIFPRQFKEQKYNDFSTKRATECNGMLSPAVPVSAAAGDFSRAVQQRRLADSYIDLPLRAIQQAPASGLP